MNKITVNVHHFPEKMMEPEKMDRRIHRTQQMLSQALMRLIEQKGFESITVQNIIDEANLGRSTFYSHFKDKEDLLIKSMDEVVHSLLRGIDTSENRSAEGGLPIQLLSAEPIFSHAQKNFGFHRALLSGDVAGLVLQSIQKHLCSHLRAQIIKFLPAKSSSPASPEVLAHFLSGTLLALLTWWLQNDMPYPPRKMENLFQSLAMPGVWENLKNV